MKIKGLLLATLSLMGVSSVFAQGVEYDDMYFSAKDRLALRAERAAPAAYNAPSKASKYNYAEEDERINPTDSYSARNINPEYTSREHTETAQSDEQEYFVDNYQYSKNQLNTWNNNFDGWYNNSWYRNNYYGPAINSWNSPYYGYDSWNSPWYDPYWAHNGWSSSFAFHYGRSWNYGWGGQYNYWNRPYYGWNWDPYYNSYAGSGWYGGSYWNNWRYPGVIIINDGEARSNTVYGKRPSRSTSIVSDRNNARSRSGAVNTLRETENSSGRTATKQEEYYNRYNRTRTATPSTSYDSRSNTQNNRSWGTRNNSNSSWDSNRPTRTSTPSYSPSRSGSSSGGRVNSGGSSSGGRGRD